MKVLIYSHFFYPSLGGVETVSLTLAIGFHDCGIKCKVITTTPEDGDINFPFEVIRNPDRKQQNDLIRWADIILFNGASLALQPYILFHRKPFVWIHVGYQVLCIDGLGWVNGKKAPLDPLSSIKFHINNKGVLWGLKEGSKLFLRRFFARFLVTKNIAITNWMGKVQPLPHQEQIYNPFPLHHFLQNKKNIITEYDFIYLGRIVSEKGISTLLRAFYHVLQKQETKLLIVGDGNWKEKMEALTIDLGIEKSVWFVGKKSGSELLNHVSKCKIAVIPSEWYEPMGGVAIEMMAAGKNIIVSEFGGLKECVGEAGLTFKNGDEVDLANCMIKLLNDPKLQQDQLLKAKERVLFFLPDIYIQQYINLLKKLTKSEIS